MPLTSTVFIEYSPSLTLANLLFSSEDKAMALAFAEQNREAASTIEIIILSILVVFIFNALSSSLQAAFVHAVTSFYIYTA